jgi:hypothetical protein
VTRARDKDAERAAIQAAADRLLAGAPLRSATGKLTGTELIAESGLRRDVVYGDHKDLVEQFQARAGQQNSTPAAMQELAEKNTDLAGELAEAKRALADERAKAKVLVCVVTELSLELEQAREELAEAHKVTRLDTSRASRQFHTHPRG